MITTIRSRSLGLDDSSSWWWVLLLLAIAAQSAVLFIAWGIATGEGTPITVGSLADSRGYLIALWQIFVCAIHKAAARP